MDNSFDTQTCLAPSLHILPPELLSVIIMLAASPSTEDLVVPLDQTSFQPRARSKPSFQSIRGLSSTSRAIRAETLANWFTVLIVRQPGDWDTTLRIGICKHVVEIRILATALVGSSSNVLARFPRLQTAFVDTHDDFVLNPGHDIDTTEPIGRYRFVIPRLPETLRRLWITNVHGPDARLIQILCQQCPHLKELWIERCTQFGPRASSDQEHSCAFWSHFPNDHDAYFAAVGVEEYAHLLGTELSPLGELEQLHMGLYLTPFEAIEAHKVHHQQMGIQRHIWEPVCSSCVDCFSQATHTAEERATEALARLLPGRSFYDVIRNHQGDFAYEHKIMS